MRYFLLLSLIFVSCAPSEMSFESDSPDYDYQRDVYDVQPHSFVEALQDISEKLKAQ